jgi:hypothetical protein
MINYDIENQQKSKSPNRDLVTSTANHNSLSKKGSKRIENIFSEENKGQNSRTDNLIQ